MERLTKRKGKHVIITKTFPTVQDTIDVLLDRLAIYEDIKDISNKICPYCTNELVEQETCLNYCSMCGREWVRSELPLLKKINYFVQKGFSVEYSINNLIAGNERFAYTFYVAFNGETVHSPKHFVCLETGFRVALEWIHEFTKKRNEKHK